MKVFFGFMVACLVIGAVLWRREDHLKTGLLLGMIAAVCALYFFTNQI